MSIKRFTLHNYIQNSKSSAPHSRDPWKYANVTGSTRLELEELHAFLSQLEQAHLEKLNELKLALVPAGEQALEPSNPLEIQPCADEQETPSPPEPGICPDTETENFERFLSQQKDLADAYQKDRTQAIDAAFNLPRPSAEGESIRPIAVFVENGTLVFRLSLHFAIRPKMPLAKHERLLQLRKAIKARGIPFRQRHAVAAAQVSAEMSTMASFSPVYTDAVAFIAQAINNLSSLCVSGEHTAVIGGIALPVMVELVEVTQGEQPVSGKLNIRLYSQTPEVRNKFSFNYNVSHAYLWSAAVPYLGNLLARLGFCALYINLMLGTSGEPSPALSKIAIHELLHTLGIQDQYRSRSRKVHPDIADNDIMYTVSEHAQILDYVFTKILTMTKKLNTLT